MRPLPPLSWHSLAFAVSYALHEHALGLFDELCARLSPKSFGSQVYSSTFGCFSDESCVDTGTASWEHGIFDRTTCLSIDLCTGYVCACTGGNVVAVRATLVSVQQGSLS